MFGCSFDRSSTHAAPVAPLPSTSAPIPASTSSPIPAQAVIPVVPEIVSTSIPGSCPLPPRVPTPPSGPIVSPAEAARNALRSPPVVSIFVNNLGLTLLCQLKSSFFDSVLLRPSPSPSLLSPKESRRRTRKTASTKPHSGTMMLNAWCCFRPSSRCSLEGSSRTPSTYNQNPSIWKLSLKNFSVRFSSTNRSSLSISLFLRHPFTLDPKSKVARKRLLLKLQVICNVLKPCARAMRTTGSAWNRRHRTFSPLVKIPAGHLPQTADLLLAMEHRCITRRASPRYRRQLAHGPHEGKSLSSRGIPSLH